MIANKLLVTFKGRRRGGLMGNVLISESSGLGSSPGLAGDIVLCS